MKQALVFLVVTCCACGGGGTPLPADNSAATLTAEQLLEQCVATDLSDFSDLFAMLANLLSAEEGAPVPELDVLAGILAGGVFPWTIDLDGDSVSDMGGTIFFEDADGNVTLPVDINDLLQNGVPSDLADLINTIPDGVSLHLTYAFDALVLQSANASSGSGSFAFTFAEGAVATTSGNAKLTSGPCALDFDFADLSPADINAVGFPTTNAGFELTAGVNALLGSVVFDGTSVAEFRGSLDGGPEEVILFDLETGAVVP